MPKPSAALVAPLLVAVAVVLGAPGARAEAPGAGDVPVAATGLARPVRGEVVARFDAPTRYGAGHRGVDLRAAPGTEVVAPAGGTVTFAGTVVGHRWVTVDHGALRSTVGPLTTIGVRAGDVVAMGAGLGTSGRAHGLAAVHWSVRRGDTYVDPLAAVRPRTATLLPTDAAPDVGHEGPWRGRVR